jgi:hypothetical protein
VDLTLVGESPEGKTYEIKVNTYNDNQLTVQRGSALNARKNAAANAAAI